MVFSGTPTLPFTREEHRARQARLRAKLAERGFDAILVFAQESHYWLTGYDSGGFVFFQCAVVTAAETPIALAKRCASFIRQFSFHCRRELCRTSCATRGSYNAGLAGAAPKW